MTAHTPPCGTHGYGRGPGRARGHFWAGSQHDSATTAELQQQLGWVGDTAGAELGAELGAESGWGDGDTAAVALPPVPEAAGGLEPRFCLLFWSRFPWRRDLCKRHHLCWRHQGHCGCCGGHVLLPTLSCPPATTARPSLSPSSSSQQGPGTHHVPLWGFCPLGIVPIAALSLTATMPSFVTTATVSTKILRGVMASLSHRGHSVPAASAATLSPPKPLCPHLSHHSHTVPMRALCPPATTASLSLPHPPHPHLSHHSHTVPIPPCVCLSPWPLCPHNSHPILTSATTVILCDTVTSHPVPTTATTLCDTDHHSYPPS